jgi:hypothetical protein
VARPLVADPPSLWVPILSWDFLKNAAKGQAAANALPVRRIRAASFPQENSAIVTNNLYSQPENHQTRNMYAVAPIPGLYPSTSSAANSLFSNILPATPFDAWIYLDSLANVCSNHKKENKLANRPLKKYE